MDVDTLRRNGEAKDFGINLLGRVHLRTTPPLPYGAHSKNRPTRLCIVTEQPPGSRSRFE